MDDRMVASHLGWSDVACRDLLSRSDGKPRSDVHSSVLREVLAGCVAQAGVVEERLVGVDRHAPAPPTRQVQQRAIGCEHAVHQAEVGGEHPGVVAEHSGVQGLQLSQHSGLSVLVHQTGHQGPGLGAPEVCQLEAVAFIK